MTTPTQTPGDRPWQSRASDTSHRERGLRLLCVGLDPGLAYWLAADGDAGAAPTVTVAPNASAATAFLEAAPVDCVVVGDAEGVDPLLAHVEKREPSTPTVRWFGGGDRREAPPAVDFDATCDSEDDVLGVVRELVDEAGTSTGVADDEDIAALRRSNAALSRCAAETAHDLNEPLRMVTSYLELIERRYADDLDDDAREFIEYAVGGAKRMRATIDAQLSSVRSGGARGPFEPVDVDDVLRAVLADLSVAIEETGAAVSVGRMPTVVGDPTGLRRLLQNLLENAIEHAGTSAPNITIDAGERADAWVFEVADDGVGIAPDRVERVFEAFARDDSGGGTGLGLAICEAIVARHGGRLWVESEPGDGAKFRFTIPR